MRSVHNRRWLLAMLVGASLVIPGVVVAARQHVASAPPPAPAPSAELVTVELSPEVEQRLTLAPAVGTCFNRVCTSNAQCRRADWCDDPSAYCAQAQPQAHYKYCFLP